MKTKTLIQKSMPFSERIQNIPKSFIREILKVSAQPDVISFAGGLPNPDLFPIEAIKERTSKVLSENPYQALQYAESEGFMLLREYIASESTKIGIPSKVENILITGGSQQGLDLSGKILCNPSDTLLMEDPTYLGAIQCLSAYQPDIITCPLEEVGINIDSLQKIYKEHDIKLAYAIPNFQNPTGACYSEKIRTQFADLISKQGTILIEDDPYGEIYFGERAHNPVKQIIPDQTIYLGSFSKTFTPGLRLGWINAPEYIMEKLKIAKQATDLHTNILSQKILYQYLCDYDLQAHLHQIRKTYKEQRDQMLEMMDHYFPKEARYNKPEGGMFLWVTLPEHIEIDVILKEAIQQKILFVPGEVFYAGKRNKNTFRLNFSCNTKEKTETGIRKLGNILKAHL